MDAGALAGCLRDKSVLITGSTGFLGKYYHLQYKHAVFVEKILRVQPAVKKIYLLVRTSHGASAEQRVMSEVTGEAVFDIQREKYGPVGFQNFIKEKVVPIDGDIMHDNLGLDSAQV
uniref:Fatty acyl-CoA reductase n=1 Tax=Aegilops tauschii TaxID=37682 RepID=N1QP41_AEGTA